MSGGIPTRAADRERRLRDPSFRSPRPVSTGPAPVPVVTIDTRDADCAAYRAALRAAVSEVVERDGLPPSSSSARWSWRVLTYSRVSHSVSGRGLQYEDAAALRRSALVAALAEAEALAPISSGHSKGRVVGRLVHMPQLMKSSYKVADGDRQ